MASEVEEQTKTKDELEYPKKYKVILLNDNYSTMEFVIDILIKIFRKSIKEAEEIMLNIHNIGQEVCGIYTYEIALTKINQVKILGKEQGYPLKAITEEE